MQHVHWVTWSMEYIWILKHEYNFGRNSTLNNIIYASGVDLLFKAIVYLINLFITQISITVCCRWENFTSIAILQRFLDCLHSVSVESEKRTSLIFMEIPYRFLTKWIVLICLTDWTHPFTISLYCELHLQQRVLECIRLFSFRRNTLLLRKWLQQFPVHCNSVHISEQKNVNKLKQICLRRNKEIP